MPRKVLIIDGDTLVYTAASNCQTEIRWSENAPLVIDVNLQKGKVDLSDYVSSVRDAVEADEVVMCLSNYDNPWRKVIMPTYKANRQNTKKPQALKALRAYVHETYNTFERPTLEGDDVCGILLTMKNPPFSGQRILAAEDKDMKTLPGMHYHLRRGVIFEVSPGEADYNHMMQTLTGDTVDGYGGCRNIGPKRAEKLLSDGKDVHEWWPLVVGAYEKAGQTADDALVNARVARICRATDYDFTKKEVILWQPK